MATSPASPTIYELAKRTGISTGTISRVLNRRAGVAPKTRKAVLDAIRQYNFRPKVAVNQTTVAVVADRVRYAVHGGYLATLVVHLIDELAQQGITVEMYTENSVNRLADTFVDGILAMSWDPATVAKLRQFKQTPIVVMNGMDLPEFSSVSTDHYQSAVAATEYLIHKGHERIAFLTGGKDGGALERTRGYTETLRKHGLTVDDAVIGYAANQPLYATMNAIMATRPTGLFVAGEDLVLEASYILTNILKLNIPQDVSVVGLENPSVSQFLSPPQTTVCQPPAHLAARAMELLAQQMAHGFDRPEHVVLAETTIIERESVAKRERFPLTIAGKKNKERKT